MDKEEAYTELIKITESQIELLKNEGVTFDSQVKYRQEMLEYFKHKKMVETSKK